MKTSFFAKLLVESNKIVGGDIILPLATQV